MIYTILKGYLGQMGKEAHYLLIDTRQLHNPQNDV